MRTGRVAIIGIGYEGFRPVVSDLSTREMMFEAASRAYDDASIEPRRDVGSFVCCTEDLWEGWSITDEMVPDQIAAAGRPLCTVPADAITGLGTVVMHLLSGIADVAVLEAHSKAGDVLEKEEVEALAQEPSLMRPLGMSTDAIAGLEMDAFLRVTGTPIRDVNRLVVDERKRAMSNPRASYAASFTESEVAGSEVLAGPMKLTDKAPFADACVVLVLASERWMKANRKRSSVYVDGVAWNSSLPWFNGGEVSVADYARRSYASALRQAGMKPGLNGFDLLELDDTYSFKLLQHLGSVAGSRAEKERILGGRGPALNPSGGSLGTGNLLEASASHRLLEAALQLRGEAGKLQVGGARRALVQSWRGIPTATGGVAILSGGDRG